MRVPSSITAEEFYAALGYQNIRDEFHGAEHTIVMEKRLEATPPVAQFAGTVITGVCGATPVSASENRTRINKNSDLDFMSRSSIQNQ